MRDSVILTMMDLDIVVREIRSTEWLPDRCLAGVEPFYPSLSEKLCGCPSLASYTKGDRGKLESLYSLGISRTGCCGFIAWRGNAVVGYSTFFEIGLANQIKFYGYGDDKNMFAPSERILVHNCISVARDQTGKGVGSALIRRAMDWGKGGNWEGFVAHNVLPDCEKGWLYHQKTCRSFWERLGFQIMEEIPADKEMKDFYGVEKKYTMFMDLR